MRDKTPKVKMRDICELQIRPQTSVARKSDIVNRKFCCRISRGGGDILAKA
jgi:hypothetical protein